MISSLKYCPDIRVVQNPLAYWNPEFAEPGFLDFLGNPISAGAWVIHAHDRQRLQLTRVVAVQPPVRPDVQPAVVKVRTPRRTGNWREPGPYELGPVRTVATYAVVRYTGQFPEYLGELIRRLGDDR